MSKNCNLIVLELREGMVRRRGRRILRFVMCGNFATPVDRDMKVGDFTSKYLLFSGYQRLFAYK